MNGHTFIFTDIDIFLSTVTHQKNLLLKTVSPKTTTWYPISYLFIVIIHFCMGLAGLGLRCVFFLCFRTLLLMLLRFKYWKMEFCNMNQYHHCNCYEMRSEWPVTTTTATQQYKWLYIIHHFSGILLLLTAPHPRPTDGGKAISKWIVYLKKIV